MPVPSALLELSVIRGRGGIETMQRFQSKSEKAKRLACAFLAIAVASFLCTPLTAFARSNQMELIAQADDESAADPTTAEPADYPFSIAIERATEAPAATAEFFIEDDGTALTWDEFMEKYYSDDEGSDDEEDSDDLDEYTDWAEDEDAEANLEDNGWFLDTEEFRWFYYAEDDNEYADGSIPSKYAAAATADGLAFGKLHDSDFGGTWYYSETGACWHLIDAQGRDHAKPSPELLAGLYEKYAGTEDEDADENDEEDVDDSADDESDDGADDESDDGSDENKADEADGEEDSLWDDSRWEDRIVGYGFSRGDSIEFTATIQNNGNAELSLDLSTLFDETATDPAVYGCYPLDGSGTHPATTPAPDDSDDEGDDDAEDDEAVSDASAMSSKTQADDENVAEENGSTGDSADDNDNADKNNDANTPDSENGTDEEKIEDGEETASDALFSKPAFTAVEGEGVIWDNKTGSKVSLTAPHVTIPAGQTATIAYFVEVTGSTENILAAEATDDEHGYAHTAGSQMASIAAETNLQTENDADSTTEPAGEEKSGDTASQGQSVADRSATVYIPTAQSIDEFDNAIDSAYEAKGAASASRAIGTKAWKRHKSAQPAAAKTPAATAKTTSKGTTAKTGDLLPPLHSLIALAVLSLLVAGYSARRMRARQ